MLKLTEYGRCIQDWVQEDQTNSQVEVAKCMCSKCKVTAMYNACEEIFDAVPEEVSKQVKKAKEEFEEKFEEGKLM